MYNQYKKIRKKWKIKPYTKIIESKKYKDKNNRQKIKEELRKLKNEY